MKKIIFILTVCLAVASASAKEYTDFSGEWLWARTAKTYGGKLVVDACDEEKCRFELVSHNGAHTCEFDGDMVRITNTKAETVLPTYEFEKTGDESDKCLLTFTLDRAGAIKVEGNERCAGFCGIGGVFAGGYENKTLPVIYKTGFDCKKKVSETEQTICRDEQLAKADVEVNELYGQTKNQQRIQRGWLENREACKNDVSCLATVYATRIRELTSIVTGREYNRFDYFESFKKEGKAPIESFLVSEFLKDRMTKEHYDGYLGSIGMPVDHEETEESYFIAYSVRGLRTIVESGFYINKRDIWLSFIDLSNEEESESRLAIYGPEGSSLENMPNEIRLWAEKYLPKSCADVDTCDRIDFYPKF